MNEQVAIKINCDNLMQLIGNTFPSLSVYIGRTPIPIKVIHQTLGRRGCKDESIDNMKGKWMKTHKIEQKNS